MSWYRGVDLVLAIFGLVLGLGCLVLVSVLVVVEHVTRRIEELENRLSK